MDEDHEHERHEVVVNSSDVESTVAYSLILDAEKLNQVSGLVPFEICHHVGTDPSTIYLSYRSQQKKQTF